MCVEELVSVSEVASGLEDEGRKDTADESDESVLAHQYFDQLGRLASQHLPVVASRQTPRVVGAGSIRPDLVQSRETS